MEIAIIGAGNAGCAHAFKLSQNGHNVRLIKTSNSLHDVNFDEITKNKGIWGIDNTNHGEKTFQRIKLITRNVNKGLKNAEIVIVLTQSLQHEYVSELISDYISDKTKLLLLIPGNLGSIFFKNKIKSDIIIAEGESTPFDARIIEPGVVNILFKNVRNSLAFLPAHRTDEGLNISSKIIDTYGKYSRSNVIESALHNPNLVVHTVGVIMSANRIEYTNGEFWMYKESFTNSIWNLINILDNEKNSVITAFNGISSSYLDECKFRNEKDLNQDSLSVFKSYANNGGPKGPSTIYSRYLFEDVPNGLCLLKNLAQKANISTPICESLITIAGSLVNTNFQLTSRTIEKLKWEDKTVIQIVNEIS